jgi:hypothetical protein
MNSTIALSIAKTFLVWNFKRMNNIADWWVDYRDIFDKRSFQDICNQDYNGDLDKCLDNFFRKTMNNTNWVQWWLYEMGFTMVFQDPIDDVKYVCDTLHKYLNECSLNDLREALDLNDYLK